jgi:hypothetical protein
MEDDKSKTSADDFDEIADDAWDFAFNRSGDSKLLQAMAILTESSQRLKVSTEESSRQANRLSTTIRNLTRALVWLTAIAVVLTGLSIYVLLHSAR